MRLQHSLHAAGRAAARHLRGIDGRRSLGLFGNGVIGPAGEEKGRSSSCLDVRQIGEEDHWLAILAAGEKMGTPWAARV